MLANWLWQGCAVALAATVMLRASRRLSATTRYHLWWVTLVTVLLLPVVSFQLPASRFQLPALSFQLPASASPQVVTTQSGDSARRTSLDSWQPEAGSLVLPSLPSWTVSLLLLLWATGTAISLARTAAALATLRRAKRTSRPFPEAAEVRLQTWLSLRSRGRQARLALSDDVRAAAVLGLTSPSIAVAPSALDALSDQELDQIVVHEWAHVQRRDDYRTPRAAHHRGDRRTVIRRSGGSIASCTSSARPRATTGRSTPPAPPRAWRSASRSLRRCQADGRTRYSCPRRSCRRS